MRELVKIETYNDTINKETCFFRRLVIDNQDPQDPTKPSANPQIMLIFTEAVDGPLSRKPTQITLLAENSTQVPVFVQLADGTLQPKMIDSGRVDENNLPILIQEHIGEFDLWEKITRLTAFFDLAIRRRKGLDNSPLRYVEPYQA